MMRHSALGVFLRPREFETLGSGSDDCDASSSAKKVSSCRAVTSLQAPILTDLSAPLARSSSTLRSDKPMAGTS